MTASHRNRSQTGHHNRPGLKSAAILVLVLISAYGAWSFAVDPGVLPLRQVQLDAPFKRVSEEQLHEIVNKTAQGGFFSVDVDAVAQALTVLPWVAAVSVRRVWPDTLYVGVVEQKPLARWRQGGVINQYGELFFPAENKLPEGLLEFDGPDGTMALMIENYREFLDVTPFSGLLLARLTLTSRRAWEVALLDGAVVVLGRSDTFERWHKFVDFYPVLAGQVSPLARVDMRYPNGFAVKWRHGTESLGS